MPRPLACLLLLLACAGCGDALEHAAVGPVVGHVDATRARIWYRAAQPGPYALVAVRADGGGAAQRVEAEAHAAKDRTMVFGLDGLEAGTAYGARILDGRGAEVASLALRTAPPPGVRARVRLAVGSCASLEDDDVWHAVRATGCDALVLLGDTPYVDAVDLETARRKHRAFLALPALAAVLRTTALWSTWDDHDYGRDRGDGRMPGKQATRQAYVEYRAQAQYGDGEGGVYTRVRYGPVEVFFLDTRFFAGLEPGAADPSAPSCLGREQWTWLLEALRASRAPFKLLASGMVWHDKGGRSADDWAGYAAERDALFAFLGEAGVEGCVLLGGDVHACQHAVFEDTGAGYPLHQFVVSPLHGRAWGGGDREHAARRWGAVAPHVFLVLEADTTGPEPALTATWMQAGGRELHRVRLGAGGLSVPR